MPLLLFATLKEKSYYYLYTTLFLTIYEMKIHKIFSVFLVLSLFLSFNSPLFFVHSQEEEVFYCPDPNSHQVGMECYCNSGYAAKNDKCVPEAETYYCEDPNSHVVGKECICNDGYGVFSGKCKSLDSICKLGDPLAHYSAAARECKCPAGYLTDNVNDKCVKIEVTTPPLQVTSSPVPIQTEVPTSTNEEIEDLGEDDEFDDGPGYIITPIATMKDEEFEELFESVEEEDIKKVRDAQEEKIKSEMQTKSKDLYEDIDEDTVIPKFPISDIFDNIDIEPEEKEEFKIQVDVINRVFDDSPDKEFTYSETLEGLVEEIVPIEVQRHKSERDEIVKEKLKKKEFKSENSKNQYNSILKEEKKMNEDLAAKIKLLGMYHRRLMEVGPSKINKNDQENVVMRVTYEMQDDDYKAIFPVSASNQFGGNDDVAFQGLSNAIGGIGKEIREMKQNIKNKQKEKTDFQNKEFDIAPAPTSESVKEKVKHLFYK